MAASTNIKLNIVEPGTPPSPTPTPTPVDPGAGVDPTAPSTGLFTHGIGGPEATIISAIILLAVAAIVVAVLYNKHKKQGKATKLVHAVDQCKAIFSSRKRITASLSALALLASVGTLAILLANSNKTNTNAMEGGTELTVDVNSEDLTVEVGDTPVFAYLPVELTVEEATTSGYVLSAYAEDTNLVSTTDSTNIIPMVATDEGELVALAENTYGLSLAKPESQDDETFTVLSTDADAPTFITDKDYEETKENDTTTIYYGFYITPDVPYGTYEGGEINYAAEVNHITTLSFNGNGSEDEEAMNDVIIPAGETITLPENTFTRDGYVFIDWNTDPEGTGEAYTDEAEYTAVVGESVNVTLYAQWEAPCPADTICYKGNNADPTTNMDNVSQYTTGDSSGKQVDLLASNFTRAGYGFVGWSEDEDAWNKLIDDDSTNDSTIYGPNQMITVGDLSGGGMKLYAVWAPAETTASGDPVSLQDWQGCSNLTATTYDNTTGTLNVGKNTITALTDNRDGNIYTVARLADGNCWMTENLRLDNEATISTANTNNPLVADNNVAIKNNDGNTSAHLSPTSNSWCTNGDSACYYQSYLNTNNSLLPATSPSFSQDFTNGSHNSSFDSNVVSYSNYYNWYSATAGNGTYDKSSGEVAGDICPAGWSLPLGSSNNTSGSFYYLNQQMGGNTSATGSNNWRSFPNNFVYSGYWGGSSANYRGYGGVYWSSTAYSTYGAYYLYFNSSYVGPTLNYNKYNGSSVRCVISQ